MELETVRVVYCNHCDVIYRWDRDMEVHYLVAHPMSDEAEAFLLVDRLLRVRVFALELERDTEPQTPPADAPPTREQQPDEDDEALI